jgi:hypothetical protein
VQPAGEDDHDSNFPSLARGLKIIAEGRKQWELHAKVSTDLGLIVTRLTKERRNHVVPIPMNAYLATKTALKKRNPYTSLELPTTRNVRSTTQKGASMICLGARVGT